MAQLLQLYYEAMNAHNVTLATSFLADDILVTFPENERNWSGIEKAWSKFSVMFERMPTFKGSFDVSSIAEEGDRTVAQVSCEFVCESTAHNSTRDMIYHIKNGKIIEIHHL